MIEFNNYKTDSFYTISYQCLIDNYDDNSPRINFTFTKEIYNECMNNIKEKYGSCDLKLLDNINDKEILYTDQYDKSFIITASMLKYLIIKECDQNIWFFLTKIIRIPQFNDTSIPFKFNKGTYAFIDAFDSNKPGAFLYNPRQTGNTTILICLYLYISIFKPLTI